MTDIKVSTLSVPRVPRNKRIYSEYKSERISVGTPSDIIFNERTRNADILSYDLGDFSTKNVTIEFDSPFLDEPVGWVKVYRYDTRSGGGYFESNVVFYYDSTDWKTANSFTINIEDYEDINGVFIEYEFTERNNDE